MTSASFCTLLLLIVNCVVFTTAQNETKVQYYLNLINESIAEYTAGDGLSNASFYIPRSKAVHVLGDDINEFDYYMNLIENEIQKLQTSNGLVNASVYIPKSDDVSEFGKFDYIIIGGGAAGSVLANRLSANPKHTVLLLEAGGYETDFTDIPAFYYYLINSEYSWNFLTTPQTRSCLGMTNRECIVLRGRGLGGSSITNTLNYIRGNRLDMDIWAGLGNPGWSYREILPLFRRTENVTFPHDPRYRGEHGEIRVEHERPNGPEYYAFVEANEERGRVVLDYNGEFQEGLDAAQFNTIRGRRQTTYKAFVKPIRNRPNLNISTYSYATKINIDKYRKCADGVTFSLNQKLYIARAKKEVILSAGSIQSPQILMLSGIGPSKELKRHKIPVIKELSVGANLQNHPGYVALLFATNLTRATLSLNEQVRQYLQGYGPLTFSFDSMSNAFIQTRLGPTPNYPDIQLVAASVSNSGDQAFNNYDDETFNSVFVPLDLTNAFTIDIQVTHPKSRGAITLRSADPYVFPLIDFNFYFDSGNLDMETMLEGIQVVLDLLDTEAFRAINTTLINTTHPDCRRYQYLSRNYWVCQIEHFTIPFYHPVGTCKMGPNPLQGAVVNNKLQVHGIKKLRVADASIMPTVVTGNCFVACVMIGEKASELILNQ